MKKAIVVGASSGIGEGMARLLAKNGYKVGVTGRRSDLLVKIKSENPEAIIVKSFDNTQYEEAIVNLNSLVEELGGLDLLVLSSGNGKRNPELLYEYEKMTVDLNVSAFTNITVWAYNFFEKQGYGHLMAISSIAGTRGNRFAPSYSATKRFQMTYLEGLKQRSLKNSPKVYITDVRPGFVDTDMGHGPGSFWIASVPKACKQIFNRGVKRKRAVIYITKRWWFIAQLFRLVPAFIYNRL